MLVRVRRPLYGGPVHAGPAIKTEGLKKRYGRHLALAGLDLEIEPGTVFGMIGPNGAGKTTTMRLLLDIIRPTAGRVRVLGQDPLAGGAALRRRIGFLPGELHLEGRIQGRDLLAHFARISGDVAKGRIDGLADRLGLDLGRPVRSLSKGNKQKLGLVQAFMHDPELLVLDEPTSGLDPLVQQEFFAMLREAKANGQTVFLSSHVLSEIQQVADAVGILRTGELVTVSTVSKLRESAMRRVRVLVRSEQASAMRRSLEHVAGLAELTATGADDGQTQFTAMLGEGVDSFVAALSGHEVADLVVEEADLEEAVLRFYGTDLRATEEVTA